MHYNVRNDDASADNYYSADNYPDADNDNNITTPPLHKTLLAPTSL